MCVCSGATWKSTKLPQQSGACSTRRSISGLASMLSWDWETAQHRHSKNGGHTTKFDAVCIVTPRLNNKGERVSAQSADLGSEEMAIARRRR